MAWYQDLAPLDYFGAQHATTLRAVGWLSHDHEYPSGLVDRAVFDRLEELLRDPWQPTICMGVFGCELCRFAPEAHGARNLFVPSGGVVFVCPELILHYINAHGYAPPDQFLSALMSCPDTRSLEYKRMLLRSGFRPN